MRYVRTIAAVAAIVGLLSSLTMGLAQTPEIQAEVTTLYGTPASTNVTIFGQSTSLGVPVQGALTNPNGRWQDYSAVFGTPCGPRNTDQSTIARISPGAVDTVVKVFVNIVGGTGSFPGSAGYVQILNDDWIIEKVEGGGYTAPGLWGSNYPGPQYAGTYQGGHGLIIDRVGGRIEWDYQGACPGCACYENELNLVVTVTHRYPHAKDKMALATVHHVTTGPPGVVRAVGPGPYPLPLELEVKPGLNPGTNRYICLAHLRRPDGTILQTARVVVNNPPPGGKLVPLLTHQFSASDDRGPYYLEWHLADARKVVHGSGLEQYWFLN